MKPQNRMPKFTKPELQIMEALWAHGALSIREIQRSLPAKGRSAYTTVQTVVYWLRTKRAVRRAQKISNAHIFEATISRSTAHRRLVDNFLEMFGGRTEPLLATLIDTGRLTLGEIQEAERILRERPKRGTST
jgi:BlaI family transcriptional regulator, penicillinase repressor